MPVHTAQSPEFIASLTGVRRLQICCPQTIQKYSGSTSTACRQDTRTHFPSATILLQFCTQYHDLFITTRTSIQDPSIRPFGGNRSNTFYILQQQPSRSSSCQNKHSRCFTGRKTNPRFVRRKQRRNMVKRKVISLEGAMVGLGFGTRLIKVNVKDETIHPELIFVAR